MIDRVFKTSDFIFYFNKKPSLHLIFFDRIYLYITFLTAFTTSCAFGNHSFNNVGAYGAGVSAVVMRWMGASRKSKARSCTM